MDNNNYYQDYSGGFNNNYPPPPPPMAPPPPPPQNIFHEQTPQSNSPASSTSIVALIFGILSYMVCPFIFGIVSWIMGSLELGKIKKGLSPTAGRGFATAGMWLGIVNVIICVLGILFYFVILVFILSSGTTHSYK
jgi:hypothetical protein